MAWYRAVALADLPVGGARAVVLDGEPVLVCRLDADEIHALENVCSHDDAPLGESALSGRELTCPRHGARFDVATGAVLKMPAPVGLETFPVRVADGWVEVEIEV